jgi:hypothetical protein
LTDLISGTCSLYAVSFAIGKNEKHSKTQIKVVNKTYKKLNE